MKLQMNSRNTSGIRGVTFDKSRNKWAVRIKCGKLRVQKRFGTFEEAEAFSKQSRAKLFGEFAYERRPQ